MQIEAIMCCCCFLFVLWVSFVFCFVLFLFLFFFKDSNMISIGTVEFRYYVVIAIPVKLGKP